MPNYYIAFSFLLVVLGLSSCATTPPPLSQPEQADPVTPAETVAERQRYFELAREYIQLATKSSAPARQDYQLRAANILALGSFTWHARQILEAIPEASLNASQRLRRRLTSAYIAILERKPGETLQLLASPLPAGTAADRQADYHRLRATAFAMEGKHLLSARERVALEHLLTGSDAIDNNHQAIWQSLSKTDKQALDDTRNLPLPIELRGWIELMRISKAVRFNPLQMRKQLDQWRTKYPNHPAGGAILNALYDQSSQAVALQPATIALLLPLSGNLKPAGEAVQNGFIAAYYAGNQPEQGRQQSIRIYDSNGAADIHAVYQQAVADGAELIVGPLSKTHLARLASSGAISIPTLALNYLDSNHHPDLTGNLFQLGLAPEDEARQAARRMWADGHNRVGVIYPDIPWGERVANAFISEWEKNGSQIVAVQTYDNGGQDFSTPVARMLKTAVDSMPAIDAVPSTVVPEDEEENTETEPPIGVDAVFMAGYPAQLRQLRPQMRFHDAGEIPIYSTSNAYTGKPDPSKDSDLNNILFCDMPWILDIDNGNRKLRKRVRKGFSISRGSQIDRLYALGVDAYNVIPVLASLQSQPYERFAGETGMLMMDENGRLHRQLLWALFERGIPRLLPASATLTE